ncbi:MULTISPECIES: GntR family transcriptional regulator [Sporolactobacillus]|jgi:DNA-binding transcriptional regulator YhcF (GntR family)|uniref:Transcriptional regulator, GntR family n=3 Tax=Sporolactobacillus TaxID=2077 RepID=A0A4Y1ZGX4_9BACL|nr:MULTISPECIES: GntR family transcriptional regulator [Sporolactobacillus]KLI03456.1 GntR family transcriptional regulator [Sporolactobacillus inulinus CASD]QAA21485.1 transcriptional regulator PtsJ [Sporolactobacillus terrae]QAA24457.1 transcriptional regulator PtsJ [Sporolactobacillus terrae]UAK16283.1 GntR family transcriptional regulator [Sporolactobacillus terrae]GAY78203.1 transcriptional regulator, GntR family [Sporolactobacillus inulinus]
MLLSIDFSSDQAIYMQIRDAIVTGIASGKLQDGDTLPSVRVLGSELGVNLHTVNKAYQLLQSEGFIDIQRRRGTFIKAGKTAQSTAAFLRKYGVPLKDMVHAAVTERVDRAVLHKIIDHLYDELAGTE